MCHTAGPCCSARPAVVAPTPLCQPSSCSGAVAAHDALLAVRQHSFAGAMPAALMLRCRPALCRVRTMHRWQRRCAAAAAGELFLAAAVGAPPPGRQLLQSLTPEAVQAVATPTASLSRVIYSTVQPGRIVRSAGVGTSRSGGPMRSVLPSLLLLAFTIATAIIAALRARLRTVRECHSCRGYGVQRCKLCSGRGTIEWEGKMSHREPCPMCLGKRMNPCTCCGGGPLLARHLFRHKRGRGEELLMGKLQLRKAAAKGGWAGVTSMLNLLRDREDDDDDESNPKLQESDQFKEQIMMD